MSEPREQELKLSFASEGDFERALNAVELGERKSADRLTNWYFDTVDGELRQQRIMLRLRSASQFILGIKVGREVSPGYFDSLEIEETIPADVAREILTQPSRIRTVDGEVAHELERRCPDAVLVTVGELITERTRKMHNDVLIEFDRIVFPDTTEAYELEIETTQVAVVERWIRRGLRELGIQVGPQRRTKMERLVAWLEGR